MENLIIVLILIFVLCFASGYVYKEKKKGNKCIGCPNAHLCHAKYNKFSCDKDEPQK